MTVNELVAKVHNIGEVLAQYVNCYLTIPSACIGSNNFPVRNSTEEY